jgi:hypothetical protein
MPALFAAATAVANLAVHLSAKMKIASLLWGEPNAAQVFPVLFPKRDFAGNTELENIA